jgi:hypothetical protein
MKEKSGKLIVCTASMHEGLLFVHFVLKLYGLAFLVCGSEVCRPVFMRIVTQERVLNWRCYLGYPL